MTERQRVGRRGEDLAAAELEGQGMAIVARNWRCRDGEIDIVAAEERDGVRTAVFCEVKCRTGLGFGHPLESLTYDKVRRLRHLAGRWLAEHGGGGFDRVRLDAVGVVLLGGRAPEVSHVRGLES